jgi:hypothetical protein
MTIRATSLGHANRIAEQHGPGAEVGHDSQGWYVTIPNVR